MASRDPIHVIGAGLAGSQAALTIARAGGGVVLHEMRPMKQTGAHRTAMAAELVCSNSLRSDQRPSTPWLLEEELRMLGSEVLAVAADTAIPGGSSLTVDRDAFSLRVTQALEASPNIRICREEVMAVAARNRQVRRERQCAAALDALAALVALVAVPGHAAALSL